MNVHLSYINHLPKAGSLSGKPETEKAKGLSQKPGSDISNLMCSHTGWLQKLIMEIGAFEI